MKRAMAIDEAVRWAYREELPKCRDRERLGPAQFGNGSLGSSMVGEFWTLPDNIFGLAIDFTAGEDAHPDARLIHDAITTLGREHVVTGEVTAEAVRAWAGIDLHGLEAACAGQVALAVQRIDLARLIRSVALLGLPDTIVDPVELRYETHANGEARWFVRVVDVIDGQQVEREADGFDRRRRRPYPQAYRKPFLDPDPVPSIVGRAKAEVWRLAMDSLYEALAGKLDGVDLRPCTLPRWPWEAPTPAVLRDLRRRVGARAARGGGRA